MSRHRKKNPNKNRAFEVAVAEVVPGASGPSSEETTPPAAPSAPPPDNGALHPAAPPVDTPSAAVQAGARVVAVPENARARVICAGAFAVLSEGVGTAIAVSHSHPGRIVILLAALESAAFLALPFALGLLPLAWVLGRPQLHALGRDVKAGLAGGRAEHGDVAMVLYVASVGAMATFSVRLGLWLMDHVSVRTALPLTVLLVTISGFGAAAIVALATRYLAWPIARLARRFPWLPRPTNLLLAAIAVVCVLRMLPASHALTPACAIAGFAIGPTLTRWLPLRRRPSRLRAATPVLAAAALTAAAAFLLNHVPPAVQMAVLYQAPYNSMLIAAVHRAVDRDGDGYSPLLLGGDCDDTDAAIHPGAVDVPDNAIDENCSGRDSHPYKPPPQPAVPPFPAPLPGRTNVVLIQLDATRPDHTSLAGYHRKTTPRLDRFAETATWFTQAYTPAPTTRLAMASLFTGLDVDRIPQRRGPGINFTLLPEAHTFAERLSEAGYDAAGYTISYVIQHHLAQGQGFRLWTTPWPVEAWESNYDRDALLTTDAGIEYLDQRAVDHHPYLLFLHYRCTHDPYIKHAEWDFGDSEIDKYDSAMAYCDSQLGRVFDEIDARMAASPPAVIVFSDHGELFGEHGLTNHGNSLYEPDVRILLVARIPTGMVHRVDDPVSLMDVAPTILELAKLPPDPASPAWSLVPYALAAPATPRPKRPLFLYADIIRANVHYEARGVVERPYKYVRDINTNTTMLFDIEHDPGELTNVADVAATTRDRLAELLDAWEAYTRSGGTHVQWWGAPPVTAVARP